MILYIIFLIVFLGFIIKGVIDIAPLFQRDGFFIRFFVTVIFHNERQFAAVRNVDMDIVLVGNVIPSEISFVPLFQRDGFTFGIFVEVHVLTVQSVVRVLVHLRASHHNGQVDAHARRAASADRSGCRDDVALVVSLHAHFSGLDVILRAHLSRHGAQGNGNEGCNAHARAAAKGHGRQDGIQVISVCGVDINRFLRLDGSARFGHGFGNHLGDDHVERAAHARGAAAGQAQRVSGDEFRGIRCYLNIPAADDPGVCQNRRGGFALEIGHQGHAGHTSAAGTGNRSRGVNQRVIRVGVHLHVVARLNVPAQLRVCLALEHHRVHAACHSRFAAGGKGNGQQPQVVFRFGVHIYIPGRGDLSLGIRRHFLGEHQGHDGSSDAHFAGHRQGTGAVIQARVVHSVHGHVAQQRILARRQRCAARVSGDHIPGHHRIDRAAHGYAAGNSAGNRRDDHHLFASRADVNALGRIFAVQRHAFIRVSSQRRRIRQGCADDILVNHSGDRSADTHGAAGYGDAARGVHQQRMIIRFNADAALRCRGQVPVCIFDTAPGNNHRDRAGNRVFSACRADRAGHQHGHILGQRLGNDIRRAFKDGVIAVHSHIAVKNTDVDRSADTIAGNGGSHGQRAVDQHGIGIGQQIDISGYGFQFRAVQNRNAGIGGGVKHAKRACHGMP